MSIRLPFIALLLAALTQIAGPRPAAAEPVPGPQTSYKAVETVEVQGGRSLQATVYRDGLRERREMHVDGQTVAIITRPADQELLMLMPGRNAAMKMKYERAMRDLDSGDLQGFDADPVAQETVNGLDTTKYRIAGDNGRGTVFDGHAWVTDDGIRAKLAGTVRFSDGSRSPIRITLKEVVRGDQPNALFTLPQGTRVMDMSKLPDSMQGGPMGGMMRQ
ncbi:hypothetical protein [Rhodovibrio salinarum]|uniref:DUF4412 domain-containing protein n=1 Tax=Rhodovibrio salinarum TaxID=1087 RepID=A0A934UZ67_9PROT|nr:hypothetical protein [Rhodovibrio salinarum]MBK1696089.1 hypothetical protein [Rhodovibrio salinarum]